MTAASPGSYDDLPESDVATVLQVPLLWSDHEGAGTPVRVQRGRHRAAEPARTTIRLPTLGNSTWHAHPLVHVTEIGAMSAVLVVALFAVVLIALALWMP